MKSQTAMEYLITYGWAILIISVVIAALFMLNVFNPATFSQKAAPGSCSVYRPDGAGTVFDISTVGTCTNEIPQYVASFDGQTSNITIGQPVIVGKSSVTYALWIYPSNVPSGTATVATTEPYNLAQGESMNINQPGGMNVNYWVNIGGTWYSAECCNLKLNQWYFIAGTYNGNNISVYVDGVSENSIALTGNITQPTGYGYIGSFGPINHFPGEIANVQIYNSALPESEIEDLYKNGIGGDPIDIKNLVGWWQLDGNANDYGGNGYNGTGQGVTYISNWENSYST